MTPTSPYEITIRLTVDQTKLQNTNLSRAEQKALADHIVTVLKDASDQAALPSFSFIHVLVGVAFAVDTKPQPPIIHVPTKH